MMDLYATCARALEPLVEAELAALGATAIVPARGGVAFQGDLEQAARVVLWSRVASRVLAPIARFPAPDEAALYAGAHAIAWADHIDPDGTIAVDFASNRSQITHTRFGAQRTKDAIVDALRDATGRRPSVDTARPDVRVNVHLDADVATVAIDLGGEGLHRRGYRPAAAAAPLRETLAAAILLLLDWPARARDRQPLVDPMCGAGTLPVEAALIAGDIAPGLNRGEPGLVRWRAATEGAALWKRLVAEARDRAVRDPAKLPPILASDVDPRAVEQTRAAARAASVLGAIDLAVKPIADLEAPTGIPGLLVANPPYGERIGEAAALAPLYAELGDVARRRFPGWTLGLLTGNPDLARNVGLRAARRHPLWNGPIECRLLVYPIAAEAPKDERGPSWRRPRPEADAFKNRVVKNLRHLRKWAKREDVHCFRVYDADLPEYAVAVDLYETAVHVQEYAPPSTVDPQKATERLRDVTLLLPEALGVAPDDVFVKQRHRLREGSQYEKLGERSVTKIVREGAARFVINLSDYLDTGLFLDHRTLRRMIAEASRGKDLLNLFSYTATASVQAALAGARSTTSVDLSNTYLTWARENFELNRLPTDGRNTLVRDDVMDFVARARRRFDVIFVAPPTHSRSKMAADFDLQRDQARLLEPLGRLLSDDGVLFFSTHFRRFKLEPVPGLVAEEITAKTIPPDFARSPRIHRVWRMTRG